MSEQIPLSKYRKSKSKEFQRQNSSINTEKVNKVRPFSDQLLAFGIPEADLEKILIKLSKYLSKPGSISSITKLDDNCLQVFYSSANRIPLATVRRSKVKIIDPETQAVTGEIDHFVVNDDHPENFIADNTSNAAIRPPAKSKFPDESSE